MPFDTNESSINTMNSGKSNNIYYIGVVTFVYVDGTKRIKVRIQNVDNGINTDDLPDSFPLLPKSLSITPKIGEKVFIFSPNTNDVINDRLYIGPITSQPQYINNSTIMTATSALSSGKTPLGPNPNMIPEAKGVYFDTNDLVFEGRENTDIVFKDSEILIRAGKYNDNKIDGVPLLNKENPSYIQLRHDVSLYNSDVKFSTINMVSDKINLITNGNNIDLTDPDKQISDDEMVKILSNAHPVPYGDKLVEYLLVMKNVLLNHVHPYNGLKAENINGDTSINELNKFDMSTILSKNIKIK